MTEQRIIIVTIDSIIGGGKSTLLNRLGPHLTEKYNCVNTLVTEPSKQWEEDGLLSDMYQSIGDMIKVKEENPEDIVAIEKAGRGIPGLFQVYAFCTRSASFMKGYRLAKDVLAGNPKLEYILLLTERSILTDREIFASLLSKSNFISPAQLKYYKGCFDAFSSIVEECKPDLCVWLDTNPQEGIRRIKIRNRPGEIVSSDYETQLYEKHVELFNNGLFCGIPVLKVDGNKAFHTSDLDLDYIAKAIYDRIQVFIK